MKTVSLLFRSKKRKEHSVENVFANIEPYLKQEYIVNNEYLPEDKYFSICRLWKNIQYSMSVKADIIHITGEIYFCALFTSRERTILTIHDYVSLENYKGIYWILDWIFMYYLPIKKCKYITCISDKVYEETIERFPFCRKKLSLIENSVSDAYKFVAKSFNEEKPVILFIGSLPHKNLDRVILALEGVQCHLDIIGAVSEEQHRELSKRHIEYSSQYGVSDEEVIKHYQACDIVCFPSYYEGFGMPIIEGQAVGRVVVTSNIEPMLSVSGKGACLVDPYSVKSIKEGIERVIRDRDYRKQLIEYGLDNCARYKADNIARKYIKLYEKVLENTRGEK